ncbi:MAG: class B sortase [Ruminococcaceae bacterium]|nr:class B sortase [Oscillospiraceae bacterium]
MQPMSDREQEFLDSIPTVADAELDEALAFVENLQKQDTVSLSTLAEKAPPQKRRRRRRPLAAFIPYHDDPIREIARKLLLLLSLLVFIGTTAVLVNESFIIPQQNTALAEELTNIRYGKQDAELTAEAQQWDGYPAGIQDDLKTLYYLNSDIRGWLKYSACGIDREVMHSNDNDYYLTHDFYKNKNKNGALFFDAKNKLDTPTASSKSLVIYGHNMASGQMFAKLNNLANSLAYMKSANQIITLDTLFYTSQYKIFAVVMQDSKSKVEHYYSIQETSFTNHDQFMKYVNGLRDRSLYDFNDVDVKASDELLILYTCTPKSIAHFDDARLAVVARKVRPGETATVSANVTTNKDVIMPYRWYTAQKKTPHSVYGKSETTSATTTKKGATTTTKKGATTTTKKGATTTTAKGAVTTTQKGVTTTTGKGTTTTARVTTTATTAQVTVTTTTAKPATTTTTTAKAATP